MEAAKFQAEASFRPCRAAPPSGGIFVASATCMRMRCTSRIRLDRYAELWPALAKGLPCLSSQNNRGTAGVESRTSPQLALNPQAFAGARGYFVRFERFTRSGCGTATYLLLRLRLAAAPRRLIPPLPTFRFSRLQLIVRISSSRTSQSSICEANTACVDRHASSK